MRKYAFRRLAGDGDQQLALVGKIKRVQPQQLAHAAHGIVHRQLILVQFNPAAAGGGEFMGYRVNAAAGGIAQGFHASNVAQRLNQGRQHRAVAGQRAVKPHLFAQVEDRCPVIAKRAADQQHVSRANLLRHPANTGGDDADPGGIDKQLIRRPARQNRGLKYG